MTTQIIEKERRWPALQQQSTSSSSSSSSSRSCSYFEVLLLLLLLESPSRLACTQKPPGRSVLLRATTIDLHATNAHTTVYHRRGTSTTNLERETKGARSFLIGQLLYKGRFRGTAKIPWWTDTILYVAVGHGHEVFYFFFSNRARFKILNSKASLLC